MDIAIIWKQIRFFILAITGGQNGIYLRRWGKDYIDWDTKGLRQNILQHIYYMIQLVDYWIWDEPFELDRFGLEEAIEGINLASKDFENRVLRATV